MISLFLYPLPCSFGFLLPFFLSKMYNRLIPIFLLFHLWRMARSDDTLEMKKCAPVQCGGVNISYPLWVSGNQPEYCGYPSLEINCNNQKPFLVNSYDTNYFIDRVFYDNNSFVLVNSILVNRTNNCSLPSLNISLGLGPMEVSRTNKELVFFSDCEPNVRASKDYFPVTCASPEPGNANVSYVRLFENYTDDGTVVPGDSLGNCTVSRIPVLGWSGSAVDQFATLMNDGFLVELKVASCSGCRNSNGTCGFDTTTSMFMCACPDGIVSPVSCPEPTDHRRSDSKHRTIIIGSAIAASVALMILVSIICIIKNEKLCIFPRKYRVQNEIEMLIEKYGSLAPRRYNYRELKKITKSFKHKLGKGGFGTVYKGSLPDGRFVAVKFLDNSTSNGEEFVSEVISIGRTSHVNVVSLLGFCIEGSNRALVYEYMSNGSLDNYIYSKDPKVVLGWEKLFDVAIGIARGLEYLHRGCNTRIVHFDIKPANILLDDDFNPKVADFGLAKLCQPKESIISLAGMRGTIGFIAPEVFSRSFGVPSTKSDVYSYGMMVLEMVGGRKNAKSNVETSSQECFPQWIYDCLAQGNEIQASDITNETDGIASKMAIVGLWCIQTLPASRPSMREVVEMMEKNLYELEMPPKPYLSSPQNSIILSLNSSS